MKVFALTALVCFEQNPYQDFHEGRTASGGSIEEAVRPLVLLVMMTTTTTTGPSDHTPVTMQLNDQTDLEACSSLLTCSPEDDFSDPFDIANTKNVPFQALKRWREAALVLNASRFRRYYFFLNLLDNELLCWVPKLLLFLLPVAKGLSEKLKTDIDSGIVDDDAELSKRKNVFGANTYPMKKACSYLRFLWEAWQDLDSHHLNCSCCTITGT
ncbi:hypothetical protein HAX54_004034 [Datura stramonium]|uniref:Uncharacterized protein n=1 Tax=Datura stramonium TaxID=4076 RepID=A0ABS8T6C5_DATST|nr:hypothetical protein [Datura stramonium]